MQDQAIQTGHSQFQIDYLIPLPFHLVTPQVAKQRRSVGSLYIR